MASKASIEAGQGHVTLKVDKSQLQRGLEESKAYLQAWGQSIASFGAAIAGAGAAITAPFAYGLSMFASFGGALSSASRKTGIEVEHLGALSAATGGDLDLFIGGIRKMSSFLDDAAQGAAGANRTLSRLGLTFGDLGNKTQDERLMMIAERLNTIRDAGERAALMRDIFGSTGDDLNLGGGRAGIQARMDRARELGATVTPEDAASAAAYRRAMGELGTVTAAIWREFGAVLAPIMTEIVKQVVTVLIAVRQWLNENRGLLMVILAVGGALMGVGTVILYVASGFFAAAMAVKGVLFVMATLAPVVSAAAGGFGLITVASWLWSAASTALSVVMSVFSFSTWTAAASAIWYAVSVVAAQVASFALAAAVFLLKAAFVGLLLVVATAITASMAFTAIIVGVGVYMILTSNIVRSAWRYIVEAVTEAVNQMVGYLNEFVEFVSDIASTIWIGFVEVFSEISDAVMVYIGPVLNFFAAIANGIISAFNSVIGWFTGTLFPMLRSVFSQIGEAFGAIWGSAGNHLGPLLDQSLGTFNAIKSALAGGDIEMAWNIVVASLQLAWARLSAFLQESWITIKFTALGIWGEVSAFVVDAFTTAWATVKSTFLDVMSAVKIAAYGVIAGILDNMAAIAPTEELARIARGQADGLRLDARLEGGNRRRDREAEAGQVVADREVQQGLMWEAQDALEQERVDALAGVGNGNIGELEANLAELRFEAAAMAMANAANAARAFGPGFATGGATSVAGSFSSAIIAGFLGASGGGISSETRGEREARVARENLERILRELERRPGVVMG